MDPFKRKIIEALKDQKPQTFQEILSKVDFTHNTLRQHLDQHLGRGLVQRQKRHQNGLGMPVYLYRIPDNVAGRPLAAILNPRMGLVVVSFDGLRRLCRQEKGGFCKEISGGCDARVCPKIMR